LGLLFRAGMISNGFTKVDPMSADQLGEEMTTANCCSLCEKLTVVHKIALLHKMMSRPTI
jgi:hypothetical protein